MLLYASLTDLIESDRWIDAAGKHFTRETENALNKPRLVRYDEDEVTSYDIFGHVIPELSGPYTDELKEALRAASDERTEHVDSV
jgi:hypothetical protein